MSTHKVAPGHDDAPWRRHHPDRDAVHERGRAHVRGGGRDRQQGHGAHLSRASGVTIPHQPLRPFSTAECVPWAMLCSKIGHWVCAMLFGMQEEQWGGGRTVSWKHDGWRRILYLLLTQVGGPSLPGVAVAVSSISIATLHLHHILRRGNTSCILAWKCTLHLCCAKPRCHIRTRKYSILFFCRTLHIASDLSFGWRTYHPRRILRYLKKWSTDADMNQRCRLQSTKFHEFPAADRAICSCRGPSVVVRVCRGEDGCCQDQKNHEDAQSSKHYAWVPDRGRMRWGSSLRRCDSMQTKRKMYIRAQRSGDTDVHLPALASLKAVKVSPVFEGGYTTRQVGLL